MAYVVTEHCTNCKYTECAAVCPVDAFHQGPTMLYINPVTCIDCDNCLPACPVEAIYKGDSVPVRYQNYIQINADECGKFPTIGAKQDAMPGALSLDQWKEHDVKKYGAA
ncbi:MAG TPA: ferredoxin [Deltaproteobacteria bacterium]|nr:MAG: hypothetical protein A2048_03975 [Deltaproteobacteria bacterium GWA2_45_12]HBF12554.1 ferredoxin [Deltaproteobacteria bacterium]